jgi:hypothetical protein
MAAAFRLAMASGANTIEDRNACAAAGRTAEVASVIITARRRRRRRSSQQQGSSRTSAAVRDLSRHVGEPRQVQLMRDGDGLGRAVAVLGQNQVRLSPTRIVAIEGVGPVQQDHDVTILF